MKAACIDGGGSWGAYTVGRLYELKPNYDVVIGCSTGALMAPLVALGDYEKLKEAYTSISSKNIFNVNPFNKKGNLKMFNAIWRVLTNKKTLGETLALKETIKKFFTIEDYSKILASNKNVFVTVCNLSKSENFTEYISIRDVSYEKFVDYMWASASVPIIGSIVNIDNSQYTDGGTTEGLPLLKILQYGCKEVDCYLHKPMSINFPKENVKNLLHLGARIIRIMRAEMQKDNLLTGMLQSVADGDSKIKINYLPFEFLKNALVFDKKVMIEWFELGRASVKNNV